MANHDVTTFREPRIAPLSQGELSEDALALATKLRGLFGLGTSELPETVATMLRHPELYRAMVEFVVNRAKSYSLHQRDLELIVLRTARLCGSAYIWGEHVKFAKKAGLGAEEIEQLTVGSGAPGWNERDRALNRVVEELHETSFVSDDTWAVIAANFTDQQIIEMLSIIGSYHEVSFLYNAMRVRLLPGSQGLDAR